MLSKKRKSEGCHASKNAKRSIGNAAKRTRTKSPVRPPPTRILATFGWNEDGQLGLPRGIIEQHRPMRVKALDGVKACAAGGQHMAAIDAHGNLRTWGCNDLGGLGRVTKDDTDDTKTEKENESNLDEVVRRNVGAVYAGGGFTLHVPSEGKGKLEMHGCFRTDEGFLIREKVLGDSSKDVPTTAVTVPLPGDWELRSVACGENFCGGITEAGDLFTFGITKQIFGQVYTTQTTGDGSVFDKPDFEGLNPRVVCHSLGRGLYFKDVACGKFHLVAIARARDGTTEVWAVGRNDQGQLGLGDTLFQNKLTRVGLPHDERISQVSCGDFHTICVTESGSMWVFGEGKEGQLGSKAKEHSAGYNQCFPLHVRLPGEHVVEVACGNGHSLVRTASNRVFSMGSGGFGKLGHGNEANCFLPKEIDLKKAGFNGVTVHNVLAGCHHSAIICSVDNIEDVSDPGSVYDDDIYDAVDNVTSGKGVGELGLDSIKPDPQFAKYWS